jgi:hypothetical protein
MDMMRWLASEFVPGLAAVVEQIVSVEEDPVGQPIVAHELSDVLGRVELGTFGRKGREREIARHIELAGHAPSRLIEKQDGMTPGPNVFSVHSEQELPEHEEVAPSARGLGASSMRLMRKATMRSTSPSLDPAPTARPPGEPRSSGRRPRCAGSKNKAR